MLIQSRNVYVNETLQPLEIELEGSRIAKIMPYGSQKPDVDYGDAKILPGLIDIHNHGYMRRDASHATRQWVKEWMAYLPSEGVTSILATTGSAPHETILSGMREIAAAVQEGYEGTNIVGIYSEGPFISLRYAGAQNKDCLQIPTCEKIDDYIEASGGLLRYVMVAPEMLDSMDVISYCVSKGIRVAIGHSGADFETCARAREAGACSFTHTYNGMRGLHHREPGVLGAAMYFKDMWAELIGDGVHVVFPAAKILAEAKGKDKLISVTDSVAIKGLPAGTVLEHPRHSIRICEDGVGRLEDGTIAGSCNRLNIVLMREIEKAGIDPVTAINSVTANPARMLGLDARKGFIREGLDADLTVLDESYEPLETYVMGRPMLGKIG